jgi:hypothetical protein
MPAHSPPPAPTPPEAVLLRLAWETVEATRRPRPARMNNPTPARTRWGRRRPTRRDR